MQNELKRRRISGDSSANTRRIRLDEEVYSSDMEGDGTELSHNSTGVLQPSNEGSMEVNEGESRRGPSSSRTMSELYRNSEEAYEEMVGELQRMGCDWVPRLVQLFQYSTSRYLADVILYQTPEECNKIREYLSRVGEHHSGQLFLYSHDPEKRHIHVVHDCKWSDRSCRCSWRRNLVYGIRKQSLQYNRPIRFINEQGWYDVYIYYILAKRSDREIWIRHQVQRLPTECETLRWSESKGVRQSLVRSNSVWNGCNVFEQGSGDQELSTEAKGYHSIFNGQKENAFTKILQKVTKLLTTYPCSPTSAIIEHEDFRKDVQLINPIHEKKVMTAIDQFNKKIIDYTLREFYDMYNNPTCEPSFDISFTYADIDTSTQAIDNLLRFQYNDDEAAITEFLTDVVDIINKKRPKTNTLAVISPPSAGKNYFFDMIFNLLLSYGQFGIANKHNNFAFQEAPDKRILLWNEPNYERMQTDFLKLVTAGDPYRVRVKCKHDVYVKRTPLIVLTNNVVGFLGDPAFADRIIKHRWQQAPFLKEYDFKPYPLCFFKILNKYNIEF